jgi:hypothetical protein
MKRTMIIATLAGALLAGPAFADHYGHQGQNTFLQDLLTQENVGRAIGTGVGALIGSRVGSGSGKTAATAVGAVGGYILGGKIGREWGQPRASGMYQGSTSTHAPAHHAPVNHTPVHHAPAPYSPTYHVSTHQASLPPLSRMPDMHRIDAPYVATTTSNVRGGPGTRYGVVDQLRHGEATTVVGRVVNSDWYMVADHGVIRGFVYAPLLRPADAAYSYRSTGGHR